jgi:hypothetical protein
MIPCKCQYLSRLLVLVGRNLVCIGQSPSESTTFEPSTKSKELSSFLSSTRLTTCACVSWLIYQRTGTSTRKRLKPYEGHSQSNSQKDTRPMTSCLSHAQSSAWPGIAAYKKSCQPHLPFVPHPTLRQPGDQGGGSDTYRSYVANGGRRAKFLLLS